MYHYFYPLLRSPDQLGQYLWRWGPGIGIFQTSPDDLNVKLGLGTTTLENQDWKAWLFRPQSHSVKPHGGSSFNLQCPRKV